VGPTLTEMSADLMDVFGHQEKKREQEQLLMTLSAYGISGMQVRRISLRIASS
jgi:hypothetical protein